MMKLFLICVSVVAIIIYSFLIYNFIIGLKQTKTRNYDIESVLDRWEKAEKEFQKN
jgi:dolichyl-phosphate-mannose--protein O-mannosyl transferase